MNYYGAKQLAFSFRTVRNNTIQIAEDIPENLYTASQAPGARSVEKMLTHICLALQFPLKFHGEKRKSFEGFDFQAFFGQIMADEAQPRSKQQVIELLKTTGEEFAKFLEGCSDEFLGESIPMPPGTEPAAKSRFELLLSVKEHEMHHRSQLMFIERLNGITPHLTRQMNERIAAMQKAQQEQSAKS